jgi:tetratricopeptide (TPR) repeat protein
VFIRKVLGNQTVGWLLGVLLLAMLLATVAAVWVALQDNLGFVHLIHSWPVNISWTSYVVNNQQTIHIECADRFLGLGKTESDDLLIFLIALRRAHNQDLLAETFAAFDDVRNHRDDKAVIRLIAYHAYSPLLGLGKSLYERGELGRAALFLDAAAQMNPNDYAILRQLIFLYRSEKRYCDMLRTAQLGVRRYGYEFYLYRAQAYEGLQAWQLAIQDFKQAAELADNEKNRKDIEANIWVVSQRLGSMSPSMDGISLCEP